MYLQQWFIIIVLKAIFLKMQSCVAPLPCVTYIVTSPSISSEVLATLFFLNNSVNANIVDLNAGFV